MKLIFILIATLSVFTIVQAQQHFNYITTNVDHSLQIETAILDGEALADGSEIGVFTPGGVCAGAAVWQDGGIELSAWIDDPDTEEVDGFHNGEEFSFKYWDAQIEEEFHAVANFTRWDEVFRAHGRSRLNLSARHNHAPELAGIGDQQIAEGNELTFDLSASDEDNDELTFSAEWLPEGASLEGAHFAWTPSFLQSGDYELTFIVSDGELSDQITVLIAVINVNRRPEWSLLPDGGSLVGYIDQDIQVDFGAVDPDGDDIEYGYEYLNDPEARPEAEIELFGGNATFIMHPNRFEYGEFTVSLTATDGEFTIETSIVLEIRSDHFRFAETGREHSIRLNDVNFLFGDHNNAPDALDEIAAITSDGLVAGAYRFTDNDEAPWDFVAWGDILNVQGIEGFRNNDEFGFLYWDHSSGEEYNVSAELLAGDDNWRLNGFSVFNLVIGPALACDIEAIDFGYSRTGSALERVFQVTSNGSMSLEGVQITANGDGFSAAPQDPFDLDIGESREITVTFAPDVHGRHSGVLTAGNELASIEIDLSGFGIEQNHFEYTITNVYETIRIVHADLDGEALSEGDEIGILTPADLVAGSIIVHNEDTWNLYACGDDPETNEVDGFRAGETMSFHIWDANADRELPAFASYFNGDDQWSQDGFAAVSLTTRSGHFHATNTNEAHHIVVNSVDYFDEMLIEGDEIAAITSRNVVAGAVTVTDDAPWEFDAYGDNPQTPVVVEGFTEGELIYFRLWDHNQEREIFVNVNVVDGSGRFEANGRSEIELTAASNDNAPFWRQVQNQRCNEMERLELDLSAIDQDNDPSSLSLSAVNLPDGAQFTDNRDGTGHFTWTPNFQQAGDYIARLSAFDGWARAILDVRITVSNTNQPPELEHIGDKTVDENQELSFLLHGMDRDGDRVTYRGQNMPFGASLVGNLFRWTPNSNQAGEYANMRFEVTDVGRPPLSDFELITITVRNVNIRPIWTPIDPIRKSEGQQISINLTAGDPDGGQLELSSGDLPRNSNFEENGQGGGVFEWQTDFVSAGEYLPYFVASDGELMDTLHLQITIDNVNRQPVLSPIGDINASVGQEMALQLTASDPDPGETDQLRFFSDNLPPHASIENTAPGEALLLWSPTVQDIGTYNNVRIIVVGPFEGHDYEQIRMTATLNDNSPPIITNISPENGEVVRTNPPTVSAIITDALAGVADIEFTTDNRRNQDFSYDRETGEFSWTPDPEIDEGAHSFRIRAIDGANNRSDVTIRFVMNSTAGEIVMDAIPEFTARSRIHITGQGEPFLSVQLYNNGEMVSETRANAHGTFRFVLVPLTEELNELRVEGHDDVGNEATPAEFNIYRDVVPPSVEITSPEDLIKDPTPEISATIDDGEGSGVIGERGILLSLDNHRINNFSFDQGVLTFQIQNDLNEGTHLLTLNAADRLGNASRPAYSQRFFVDSRAPVIVDNDQNLFDDVPDSLANRNPDITIAFVDPEPGSGIDWDSVVLTFDGAELQVDIDSLNGTIAYSFANVDPIEPGDHELVVSVTDFAGNELSTRGEFYVGDVADEDGPFFVNQSPPAGGVVGAGLGPQRFRRNPQDGFVADTLSFGMGDNDAGINPDSTRIWLNGRPFGQGGFRQMGGGLVEAPLWFARGEEGHVRMPLEMPGLEEGLNFANAFGVDNDGNIGEAEWGFFFDADQPETPSLNAPERDFVNVTEVTITGHSAGDSPDYDEGYENIPIIRIYRNDEMVAEITGDYNADFSAEGVVLTAGLNVIEATVVDAGGNESELSEPIEIYLDIVEPEILDFTTVDGQYIADATPTFTATVVDDSSGIDAEATELNVEGAGIEISYDAENGVISGTVQDALEDGDHVATLVVYDRSGNMATSDYSFNVDTQPVLPPEFTLQPVTSENQIVLSGSGVIGQDVVIYLGDQSIDLISLSDSAEFSYISTRDDLSDTSYVRLASRNAAGIESELSEAQQLINDSQPPTFSNFEPEAGSSVLASELHTIVLTVTDTVTGIDIEPFELNMRGEALEYFSEQIEFGYRISADVSNFDFGDNETVELNAIAVDNSIPQNQRYQTWQFVTTINQAPTVALPDTVFNEDEELQLYVFDFISDPDNRGADPEITYELLQGADNAEVTLDEYGFLTVAPEANFFGEIELRIQAEDAFGLTGADTSIVTVYPVNDKPVIGRIENAIAFIGQEFSLQIEATDIDQGDTITFTDDFDFFTISANGLIEFTPTEEMGGLYNVMITASDQHGGADSSSFQIFIAWVNNEIEIVGEMPDVEIDEDAAPVELTDLDDVFSDPDGQELRYSVEYSDDGEGFEITIDVNTNVPLLTLNPDFFGDVAVTITADDYSGSQVSVDFTVYVSPVNDPPTALPSLPVRITVDEDAGNVVIADLDTIFYDVDNDNLLFTVEGIDELGLQLSEDNLLSFQTSGDWNGIETITITADDQGHQQRFAPRLVVSDNNNQNIVAGALTNRTMLRGRSPLRDAAVSTELMIEVRPVNDAPRRLVDDPYVVHMEEDQAPLTLPISIAEMFEEIDQNDHFDLTWQENDGPLSLTNSDDNSHLVATLREENWFTDEYEYPVTAIDQSGAETQLTLSFVVSPVNDPPVVAQNIDDLTVEEDTGPWAIADLDQVFFDVENDQLTFDVELPDPLQWEIDEQSNVLTITAPANYNGANIGVIVTANDNQERLAVSRLRSTSGDFTVSRDVGPVRKLRSTGDQRNDVGFSLSSQISLPSPQRDDIVGCQFSLTISPVNDEPVWVDYPAEEIVADAGDIIEFSVEAQDIDNDELEIALTGEGLPEEAGFERTGNGSGLFVWQTTIDNTGQYDVIFTVSDGVVSVDITIPISIIEPHSHFFGIEETGLSHTVEITSIFFDGEAIPSGWEVGVFTPDGTLSGAGVWQNDPLAIAVWGADENHDNYFHDGELMNFRLWDNDADVEWSANPTIEEGPAVWSNQEFTTLSLDGFSAKELSLPIHGGWNLISINVTPTDEALYNGDPGPEVIPMLEQLRIDANNHHVFLFKDGNGRFYSPARHYNGIPYWNLAEGYQIKVDEDVEPTWTGTPIDPQADLPVRAGWSVIAYWPDYELDASAASHFLVLSPILDDVVMAKDGAGRFLRPDRNFGNMQPWREGLGYQLNMRNARTLNYPENPDQAAVSIEDTVIQSQGHWADVQPTGANMSILITSVKGIHLTGSIQIAAFSSTGRLVGVGSAIEGQVGLAVWGDDPTTADVDGLLNREPFALKLWNPELDEVVDLGVSTIEGNGLVFETDGFTVASSYVVPSIPTAYYLGINYPNPFNPTTTIHFGLPEASHLTIWAYDVAGHEVATLVSGELQAGDHSVMWNSQSLVTGVYIIKMEANGFTGVRKVILIK